MVLRSLRWPSDHRFGIENMADTEVKPVKYLCLTALHLSQTVDPGAFFHLPGTARLLFVLGLFLFGMLKISKFLQAFLINRGNPNLLELSSSCLLDC